MSPSGFTWTIELPARGTRAAGGRRPRALLRLSSETHGEESLSVPVAVGRRLDGLAREDWEAGSRAELLHRLGELSRACAHDRMEELVGRRDYSSSELAARLREEGYPQRAVDPVVSRACEVGIVDDARFGAAFARSKVLAGWGRLRIERELSRRGVAAAEIPGWPDEFVPDEEERSRALALASRRRLSGKNDYQKIVRFLCSRGFSVGVATSVAREVLEANCEDPR